MAGEPLNKQLSEYWRKRYEKERHFVRLLSWWLLCAFGLIIYLSMALIWAKC